MSSDPLKAPFCRKLTDVCEKLHQFKEMQDRMLLKPGQAIHKNPAYMENLTKDFLFTPIGKQGTFESDKKNPSVFSVARSDK